MEQHHTLAHILRQEQLRYTNQRQAVWDELKSTDAHRDAEEIYMALRQDNISVSRATVYRTIDVLVKYKLINKIDIGDGRSRYEHANNIEHHDHLICTNCGKILEFFDESVEELQCDIAKKYGFKLDYHIHQLFGLCKACK